ARTRRGTPGGRGGPGPTREVEMVSCVLTWLMAAALGQAPKPAPAATSATATATGEDAWLRAVPVQAEVVIHTRALTAVRDDFMTMLKAMSPSSVETVDPVVESFVEQLTTQYGEGSVKRPLLLMMKVPKLDAPPDDASSLP